MRILVQAEREELDGAIMVLDHYGVSLEYLRDRLPVVGRLWERFKAEESKRARLEAALKRFARELALEAGNLSDLEF